MGFGVGFEAVEVLWGGDGGGEEGGVGGYVVLGGVGWVVLGGC